MIQKVFKNKKIIEADASDASDKREIFNYKVTTTKGDILWVPHDENNTDYQDILKWVAAGNTIEEAD
tara:strand:+ start:422 stop:622 length:201 start_codon:yes stop_codon:yes gene_type:complete